MMVTLFGRASNHSDRRIKARWWRSCPQKGCCLQERPCAFHGIKQRPKWLRDAVAHQIFIIDLSPRQPQARLALDINLAQSRNVRRSFLNQISPHSIGVACTQACQHCRHVLHANRLGARSCNGHIIQGRLADKIL